MNVAIISYSKNYLKIISIILILYVFVLINCDVTISKLNKDVLKDFENYKIAHFINKTHFSCDDGNNILHLNKFNDDFCDCKDGSDENSKKIKI